MLFHQTPLEVALVAAIFGGILLGILALIAALIRAAFDRCGIGSTARNYILAGGAAAAIGVAAFFVIRGNALGSLERDCRDRVLAEPRMAGVSRFTVERHYDFWNRGASGGGFVAPWSVSPHTVPKIIFVATFYRDDNRPHRAWIECLYANRAGSSDPPQLAFDKVNLSWENVLAANRWQPWRPRPPAAK